MQKYSFATSRYSVVISGLAYSSRFEELKHLVLKKTERDLEEVERIKDVLNALPSANIELSNTHHEERFIQFLYYLSTVQQSEKKGNGSILFESFVQADIASILKIHFVSWKGKKFDTIQKVIGKAFQKVNFEGSQIRKT